MNCRYFRPKKQEWKRIFLSEIRGGALQWSKKNRKLRESNNVENWIVLKSYTVGERGGCYCGFQCIVNKIK